MHRTQISHFRRRAGVTAILAVIGVFAGIVLTGGDAGQISSVSARRPTGSPQLISVEPFPVFGGEMCQWMPASAGPTLVTAWMQEQLSARAATPALEEQGMSVDADRAPVRIIRDSYPTYSAIAVDTNSNEVYLQDENLFGYKVFNRLDDTPPSAAFTEPKRMVGGINTKLEFNCGLYVDPNTGDVYSVNNDTVDTMVVFPREARGNVAPKRELRTPHGTWGIAVNEEAQELYLTVEHINSVVVYRKMAEGEEKPLRTLAGDQTRLADPHGVALDTKNNWLFVANHGNLRNQRVPGSGRFLPPAITVYPLNANGNTAPLREIAGPNTQLNWPAAIAVDPGRGELYVANDTGDSILVFGTADGGDVAPKRAIRGPKTGIKNPTGVFVDLKNEEVWVSNMGNASATVYPLTADGDVAPLRTIRSAPLGKLSQAIGNPGAVEYDSKREEVLVPN